MDLIEAIGYDAEDGLKSNYSGTALFLGKHERLVFVDAISFLITGHHNGCVHPSGIAINVVSGDDFQSVDGVHTVPT